MATTADKFAKSTHYYATGELALAERYSWEVLSEEPNHAEALHLLGSIFRQKGEIDQALEYLNRSLICNGSNATVWKDLGDVQAAVGDFFSAVAGYAHALRLRPDFGEASNNLGLALLHLGEWESSAKCFQQAIRHMPSSGPAYCNLGIALYGLGQWAEAADAFEHALRLQPDNARITYNLGLTFHKLGELDWAVIHYRQALRLKPDYPGASNNLATALKEQGLLDEAVAQLQETLKLQPDLALAYYNLSEFAAEGRYDFSRDELERIKDLTTSEHSASDRSVSCFALATILNKQGKYDEAFVYYKKANDLRKRLNEERNLAFDAKGHDAHIDRIIDLHDQAYFKRSEGWGIDTDLPIFIIGMPRSGSTLVEQILASHPSVFGAGELGLIHKLMSNSDAWANAPLKAVPTLSSQYSARNLAQDYLQYIANMGKGAARVTVKTLENYLHLGVIETMFRRPRIIHCRRDPLDVCLSCYFQKFDEVIHAWSLEDIGACYKSYEKLMAHWLGVLPFPIHEVYYEDLVRDQETVTRKLLDYCGLEWDEHCLSFYHTRRSVRTASTVQVRKPITDQAIGRWKHYVAHLDPLFKALGYSSEINTQWPDNPSSPGQRKCTNSTVGS